MEQFLTDLLRNYGVWAALLWALIETDLIFLVVGAFSSAGYLSLWTCLPAAIFSALMHDTIIFWLAQNRADWVRKQPAYQKVGQKVEQLARKVGPWSLSICRILYGTRYPTVIFWGLQRLAYPRFWFTDGLGLVLWAFLLTWLGHLLGDQMDAIKRVAVRTQEISRWVLLFLLVAITVTYGVRRFRRPKGNAATDATVPEKETEKIP
jgi:membrane protein DedA with SNARE-associated domain